MINFGEKDLPLRSDTFLPYNAQVGSSRSPEFHTWWGTVSEYPVGPSLTSAKQGLP